MWSGKTIVLGITGGIAAYKAAELVSTLRQRGASVEVVMTAAACQFVTPLTFRELSGNQVAVDLFAPPARYEVQHVGLAERADVIAIVPATANTVAKIAQGLADNLLTSVVLAAKKPVLLAPAMNVGMYENQITQKNLELLRERGFVIVGPASGRLLCGAIGAGRLAPAAEILFALEKLVTTQDLSTERLIITAGGTREAVDPVRFLGNRSSGRMGVSLAQAFALRGASVTLIAGAMEIPPPSGVDFVAVESTGEMQAAVFAHLPAATGIIMAGAPADFRPSETKADKLKRERETPLNLALVPTEDIAAAVGQAKRPEQLLVAFAAETGDLLARAQAKLQRKQADLMVANDVTAEGSGFGTETNQVSLLTKKSCKHLPLMTKDEVARAIADAFRNLRLGRELDD